MFRVRQFFDWLGWNVSSDKINIRQKDKKKNRMEIYAKIPFSLIFLGSQKAFLILSATSSGVAHGSILLF